MTGSFRSRVILALFKLPSTLGNDIALSDFRGKKWVLLEFYAADFVPA